MEKHSTHPKLTSTSFAGVHTTVICRKVRRWSSGTSDLRSYYSMLCEFNLRNKIEVKFHKQNELKLSLRSYVSQFVVLVFFPFITFSQGSYQAKNLEIAEAGQSFFAPPLKYKVDNVYVTTDKSDEIVIADIAGKVVAAENDVVATTVNVLDLQSRLYLLQVKI